MSPSRSPLSDGQTLSKDEHLQMAAPKFLPKAAQGHIIAAMLVPPNPSLGGGEDGQLEDACQEVSNPKDGHGGNTPRQEAKDDPAPQRHEADPEGSPPGQEAMADRAPHTQPGGGPKDGAEGITRAQEALAGSMPQPQQEAGPKDEGEGSPRPQHVMGDPTPHPGQAARGESPRMVGGQAVEGDLGPRPGDDGPGLGGSRSPAGGPGQLGLRDGDQGLNRTQVFDGRGVVAQNHEVWQPRTVDGDWELWP